MKNDALHDALEDASIPTLLMCLAHITGGGLARDVADEVRVAIAEVMQDVKTGKRQMSDAPDTQRLTQMMSVCVGETVGSEYVPMFMEDLHFVDRDVSWSQASDTSATRIQDSKKDFSVLIVGAGISGIGAAIALDRLGISWTLVEKNTSLGGTWLENNYPEAGVDTPNHFYSYSYARRTDWPGYFSKRDDVLGYLEDVAEQFGISDCITFGTTVDEMTWDESHQAWSVVLRDAVGARTILASAVISATGQLNRPKKNVCVGSDTFGGDLFHSAEWRHDVDLAGKRVAVVGTGASAMQFLRSVASTAESVVVFQRSPQWVIHNEHYHREVSVGAQWLLENIPYYYEWYRFGLFWRFGDGLLKTLRRDLEWQYPDRSMNRHNDRHRQQMIAYIEAQLVGRPDLVKKSLPGYPPYGKRILVDNDWFQTLRRPNVELVTASVEQVHQKGVIDSDGVSHEVDVIILATGFEAGKLLSPMKIRGRTGTLLSEVWGDDDPRAYLGITVPDYPNLFCLYGPNTNVAHGGSLFFQAECQLRYVTSCLVQMLEGGVASIDVQKGVHDDYNGRVDEEHSELVWTHPGMRNWYRNAEGRVFSPMPWRFVDYWEMTHDADLAEYHLTRQ
ncbi:MAG: NAD(P)/FAD-dependent oxidoreductase [Actinobacteria bacterium]|nr:NAD(P)/FAD-dependent oxidoreductase [Actinomycetota bacterium]